MKERPILFSGPMVRAILEGRKTVTRRAVKGHQIPKENPAETDPALRWTAVGQKHPRWGFVVPGATEEECASALGTMGVCPYGKPGDRLWVREAWSIEMLSAHSTDNGYDSMYALQYRADDSEREIHVAPGEPDPYIALYDSQRGDWRPSIHMPRWASRTLLEITAVRVERLQDISNESARAEGVQNHPDIESGKVEGSILTSKALFECLWCDTYGDDSWFANPWVWVVEFKRVTP